MKKFTFTIAFCTLCLFAACSNLGRAEETESTDSTTLADTGSILPASDPITTALNTQQESTESDNNTEESTIETVDDPGLVDAIASMYKQNESNSNNNVQSERRMINWYCAWCCKIIQKSDKPDGGSCNGSYKNTSNAGRSQRTSHGGHSWYELSIVGNRKFECSHCHVIIDSENKPDNYKGVCDGYDDKLDKHYWNEL